MGFGFLTDREIKNLGPQFLGNDFSPGQVEPFGYRLCLGEEVYASGRDYPDYLSTTNPYISVPRGQFALLMTKETLRLSDEYMALISIRLSKKELGLINVSGFHVDPGFKGKLMFSVFNAGPSDVVLKYGDEMFLIFFYKLEHAVDKDYDELKGEHQEQEHLPVRLVTSLKGTSASLSDVDKRVRDLEVANRIFIGLLVAALAAGLVALVIRAIFFQGG